MQSIFCKKRYVRLSKKEGHGGSSPPNRFSRIRFQGRLLGFLWILLTAWVISKAQPMEKEPDFFIDIQTESLPAVVKPGDTFDLAWQLFNLSDQDFQNATIQILLATEADADIPIWRNDEKTKKQGPSHLQNKKDVQRTLVPQSSERFFFLDRDLIESLPSQSSINDSYQVTLPRNLSKGIYHLILTADVEDPRAVDMPRRHRIGIPIEIQDRDLLAERRSGTRSVVIDFEGIAQGPIPPNFYMAQGVEIPDLYASIQPGSFWCNNASYTVGWNPLDSQATINVPNGFDKLAFIVSSSTVGGPAFTVYSGVNGTGSVIYSSAIPTHPQNGNEDSTPCSYPIWSPVGPINFNSVGRSVVFTQSIHNGEYGFLALDDIDFQVLSSGIAVFDEPIAPREGEFDGYTFRVGLDVQPEPGKTVDLTIERFDSPDGSENMQVTGSNTVTFTSSNWATPQPLTIWAPENDANHTNGTAQFRIYQSGGTSSLIIDERIVIAHEIDDDFTLTIESFDPMNGDAVGGTTIPKLTNEYYDIDDNWQFDITAIPDSGYNVATTWTTTIVGEQGNPDSEGVLQLSDPVEEDDGSVTRNILNFTLDPDGLTSVSIRPAFFELDPINLTVGVGSGEGITSPSGTVQREPDAAHAITATPASGYQFTHWAIVSGSASFGSAGAGSANTDIIPTSDTVVVAHFAPITQDYDLTVSASPQDGGTTTPSNTITVTAGQSQTITATPNPGWFFDKWLVTGNVTYINGSSENNPTIEVNISSDAFLIAQFTEDIPSNQGLITPNPITIPEEGSRTVTLRLAEDPIHDIVLMFRQLSARNCEPQVNGQIYDAQVVVNSSNWTGISISVSMGEDTNDENGVAIYQVIQSGGADIGFESFQLAMYESEQDITLDRIFWDASELSLNEGECTCCEQQFDAVLRLPNAPDGKVLVDVERLNFENNIGVYPESGRGLIEFTENNWNTGVRVGFCVEEGIKEDIFESFVATQVGSNQQYADSLPYVVYGINDPTGDNARFQLTPTSAQIEEGGTQTFQVTLIDPPNSTVSVRLDLSSTEDFTVVSPSTHFNLSQNVPTREFVIRSNEDSDELPDTGTVRVIYQSGGIGFISSASATLLELDNDANRPQLLVTPATLDFPSNGLGSLSVVLSEPPETNVSFSLTARNLAGAPGLVIQQPVGGLTFTPQNYNQPQTITLAAATSGSGELAIEFTGGTPMVTNTTIPVTIGSPAVNMIITPPSIGFNANGSGSFTVKLSEPPTTDIQVGLTTSATSGNPNLRITTPSSKNLVFTAANYDTPQRVYVTATSTGEGRVHLDWISGSPQIGGAIVPVAITNATCSGSIQVNQNVFTINEGQSMTFTVTQTNNYNFGRNLRITSVHADADAFDIQPSQFTAQAGVPVTITITALEDNDIFSEDVIFRVEQPDVVSPPCSIFGTAIRLVSTDDDFNLQMTDLGAPEPMDIFPASGQHLVDTTDFTPGNPLQLLALPGTNYVFDYWSGDTHLLQSLPGSPAATPVNDPAPILANFAPNFQSNVLLTAHYREANGDIAEEIDAFLDALLAQLLGPCGMGGADFSDTALEDPNRTGNMAGGRILPHSGQEIRDETDLALPGLDHPTNLRITRRHMTRKNFEHSIFGPGWTFNYRITFNLDDDGNIRLSTIGREDLFVSDPNKFNGWIGTGGRFERIDYMGGNRTVLRAPTGVKWEFLSNSDPTQSDFQGILSKIVSPNGNEIRLEYETGVALLERRLMRMVDAFGRDIDFLYESPHSTQWVTKIIDRSDPLQPRSYLYNYSALGQLLDVTSPGVTTTLGFNDFPLGKKTVYTYHGHADPRLTYALTSITYPNQVVTGDNRPRYTWTYEDSNPSSPTFGFVTNHMVGDPTAPSNLVAGGEFTYSYRFINRGDDVNQANVETTIHDREGTRTVVLYNRRGMVLSESVQVESGSPGKTAVHVYETNYRYNATGDLIERKDPINLLIGGRYQEFHPDPQTTPRLLQQQERRKLTTADSRGGDQTVITAEFAYEPIFNKYFSAIDPRGLDHPTNPSFPAETVTTWFFYDYMEDLSNAVIHFAPEMGLTEAELIDLLVDAGIPAALQAQFGIDALAGETVDLNGDGMFSFQPCGNLLLKILPDVQLPNEAAALGIAGTQHAEERYWYNGFGQLVRHIDAEGNHHVREYFPFTDVNGFDGSASSSDLNAGGGFLAVSIEDAAHEGDANSGFPSTPTLQSTTYAYTSQGDYPRNARGVPTAVINGRGIKTEYLINERDQVIAIIHAAAVDPSIAASVAALRYMERFRYDSNDNLVEKSIMNRGSISGDTPGFFFQSYTYNILDQIYVENLDTQSGGLFQRTIYRYDRNENLIEKVSAYDTPDRSIERWSYDARDFMTSYTRGAAGDPDQGEEATTTYRYDENGSLLFKTDADGDTIFYTYDGLNRLKTKTNRIGTVEERFYDAANNVIATEHRGFLDDSAGPSVLLRAEAFDFDERGRAYQKRNQLFHYPNQAIGVIDPGDIGWDQNGVAEVRSIRLFDRLGRIIATVDPDGDLTETDYDGLGRTIQQIDALGNTTSMIYDGQNNLIGQTVTEVSADPQSNEPAEIFTTTHAFDALDRRTRTVEPNGQLSRMRYDSRGNLVKTIDALGNEVTYQHDGLNRQVRKVTYLNQSGLGANAANHDDTIDIQTTWDFRNRIQTKTDGNGSTTTYSYDDLDRLTGQLYADGTSESWRYNGDGELQEHIDQRGHRFQWSHNPSGRPTQVTVSADFPTIGTRTQTWRYDGLNRVTYAFDDNGDTVPQGQIWPEESVSCHYVYDSLSRPILEVQAIGAEQIDPFTDGKQIEMHYAGDQRLVAEIYPNQRQILRTYDALDRLDTIVEANTNAVIADFDYFGSRDRRLEYNNGIMLDKSNASGPFPTIEYGYDANGRDLHHTWRRLSDGSVVADFANSYNGPQGIGTNRRVSETRSHLGQTDTWNYDSVYRMTLFDRDNGTLLSSRVLDATDKMTNFNDEGTQRSPQLDILGMNQYDTFDGQARSYDDNGNLSDQGDRFLFQFDAFNRLITVKDRVNGDVLADYYYDANNRRIRKVTATQSNRFIYQGWKVMEERDGNDLPTLQFVTGRHMDEHLQIRLRPSLSLQGGGTVDPAENEDFFYIRNAQGFTGAITDASGNVVEYVTYSMLGKPRLLDGNTLQDITPTGSLIGNPYLFQGRRFDDETGLYYYRNRFYDPNTGEFLSFDPLGMWHHGQGNGYGAFAGDPWNNLDPMGEETFFGIHIPFTNDNRVEIGAEFTQVLIDFNRGAADNLTFGITRRLREGIYGERGHVIDENAHFKGEIVETVIEVILTGGSAALKHQAKKAIQKQLNGSKSKKLKALGTLKEKLQMASRMIRNNARSRARRKTPGTFKADGAVHHRYPLLGHPSGRHTLFPTMGVRRLSDASFNLKRLDSEAHDFAHASLEFAERGLRFMMNQYTGARVGYLVYRHNADAPCNE